MEPNETVLSSYYHPPPHHQSQPPPPNHSPTAAAASSPPNGVLSNSDRTNPTMAYPHSVSSAVSPPLDTAARKRRGRPRKYNTPEEAAAARRAQLAQPKKDRSAAVTADGGSFFPRPSPSSSKVTHLAAFGNIGQGFTPHIISVSAGEDVYQRIMLFMQQSQREICILSASGSVSSPFLRQPATSGGNVTYEGRFDILSLSGSYVRTELGGRTGGLSVCLSNANGQIIGGGIGGPLRAAGPVEVIVGTFLIDTKKNIVAGAKGMEQML